MHFSKKIDEAELCDTSRLECFSDGAFAIIITLLVLEIHRPNAAQGALAKELLDEWPSYLAYAVAFLYVGVIWLNHHGRENLRARNGVRRSFRGPTVCH